MPQLNPALASWLPAVHEAAAAVKASGIEPTPISVRDGLANLTKAFVEAGPELAQVKEFCIPTRHRPVPVRAYIPDADYTGPAIIFSHGGGHMAGSVTVYDGIARRIAKACNMTVLSVEYRLSPEHPHPAGLEDLVGVAKHFAEALDLRGIGHNGKAILMGDSGGGAISAMAAQILQHHANSPVLAQVLVYPSLDYTLGGKSVQENGKGLLLETDKVHWYFDNYFQKGEDRKASSPLHREVSGSLAPALVFTAEYCVLRDEGVAYVEKLKEAGVAAQHCHFDDMIHAFLNLESMVPEACEQLYSRTAEYVRQFI
ncbi:alpha/beta hydrolase [Biformimicrobium ophioploci]|uniref:Alpha/beta hydrolase fold-3 domain-containing protein n=1 Tax=Biformimicrobium ophioploci TaxID=3036711 RepID=A0ABQ6M0V4_9GAMM|nr:alpha/beta hydrolase [Microbulbifer sp. NKW57]GMG87927.1 hypothetical protein MNKW57_22480 [Microbulbifer sp. NKW57]